LSNTRYTRYRVDPYAPFVIEEKAKNRFVITSVKILIIMTLLVFSLGIVTISSYARDGMKGRN
jgi:hypothetical protein